MRRILSTLRAFIPNGITLLNLLSGCTAIVLALKLGATQPYLPVLCIFAGALFDFFDGFTARLLRVQSPLGVQLDSLADLITFGLAPSILYVQLQFRLLESTGSYGTMPVPLAYGLALFPLLLAAFSAYRLGKFNIDTRQTSHFLGLATPASALFTCGLTLAVSAPQPAGPFACIAMCPYSLFPIVLVQGILLVSEIPMFSLKIKQFTLEALLPHIVFIVLAVPSVILLGWGGLAIAIVEYVLVSIAFRKRIVHTPHAGLPQ